MNPVRNVSANSYSTPSVADHIRIAPENVQNLENASPLRIEHNQVTLSAEGRALLNALQQLDHESKKSEANDKSVGQKVESFTHGALGMKHPAEIEEEKDRSYSAGQYLSAALTVGGTILALA